MIHAVCILLTAVLWSTAGVLVKTNTLSPLAIACCRGLLSFAVLLCLRLLTERRGLRAVLPRLSTGNLSTALAMFATSTLYTLAIKLTSASNAVVLQYIAPILVLLHAMCFAHRQVSIAEILLTCLVFIGCVLTFIDKLSADGFWGNVLAITSGFTMAAQIILSRRKQCQAMDSMMLGSLISFVVFLPALFSSSLAHWTMQNLLSLMLLGVFQYGLANFCYAKGIKKTDAVAASLLLTLEPVLVPVWVFLFTDVMMSGQQIVGFLLVVIASTAQSVLAAKRQ